MEARRSLTLASIWTCLLMLAGSAAAQTLFTQNTPADGSGRTNSCVYLENGRNQVAGIELVMSWDPACMSSAAGSGKPKCRSNPDTGKTVQSALKGPSTLKAIMLSFSDTEPIPDGLLFCCEFQQSGSAPAGGCPVAINAQLGSTSTGQRLSLGAGPARGGRAPIAPAGEEIIADSESPDDFDSRDDSAADRGSSDAGADADTRAGAGETDAGAEGAADAAGSGGAPSGAIAGGAAGQLDQGGALAGQPQGEDYAQAEMPGVGDEAAEDSEDEDTEGEEVDHRSDRGREISDRDDADTCASSDADAEACRHRDGAAAGGGAGRVGS